jgi:membrane-associated phospholipid phosphatase
MRERPLEKAPNSTPEPAPPAPQPPSRFTQALAWLGPDFTLFLLFATVLTTVGRIFGAHYELKLSTMLLPGLVAPGIIIVRSFSRFSGVVHNRPGARAEWTRMAIVALRSWVPLVLVAIVFDNLENYTGLVRKLTIDTSLYKIDLAIFGVEPTVWIQQYYRPLLTDWMATCYGSFLIIPMILGVILCLRDRSDDFREIALAVMLQMWLAFFIFICFPAGPPRYYQPLRETAFIHPIPSLLGFNNALQAKWDTYSPLLVRASFPSLHCAYALMTLIYSWRFGDVVFPKFKRLWFALVVPFELTLFVSVVYLRHHWIPDMVCGMTVAFVVSRITPVLRRVWPKIVRRQQQPQLVALQ